MDDRRLDFLSRALARRGTRRQSLEQAAKGGALAAGAALGLGAAATVAPRAAAAQDNTVCTLPFAARFATGPDADVIVEGELSFAIAADGDVADGTLAISGGDAFPLVGTASGRALTLRVAVQDDGFVTLVGGSAETITACTNLSGFFGGPLPSGTGTWAAGDGVLGAPVEG